MSFTRAKADGWIGGQDPVTAAQLNQIDLNQSRALDGNNGGTYSLGAFLQLEGSGVRLGGANHQIISGGTLTLKSGGTFATEASSTTTLVGPATAADLTMTSTNKLKYASRSLTRLQRGWHFDVVSLTAVTPPISHSVGASTQWRVYLDVPHGAQITAITLRIDPADDTLPTNKARVDFSKHVPSTGVTTPIVSYVDPSADGVYQTNHTFGPSGLTETVANDTTLYFIDVFPESGGDFDNYTWISTSVTYTITEQDEGR